MRFSALRWMSGAVLYALATLADAQPSGASRPEIVPCHAFSDAELTAVPVENWITNGGSSFNQRYSPLTQINRFNVKDLKALWKTEMGSADQYKNGGQAQILHYKGTLFVANGVNDVFAIDVLSGEIKWKYAGNTDPLGGNLIGWVSRGVAMGEGMAADPISEIRP